jgi:hypothetical protein
MAAAADRSPRSEPLDVAATGVNATSGSDALAPPMRFMALAVRCSAAGVLSLPPPQAASTRLRAKGSPVMVKR